MFFLLFSFSLEVCEMRTFSWNTTFSNEVFFFGNELEYSDYLQLFRLNFVNHCLTNMQVDRICWKNYSLLKTVWVSFNWKKSSMWKWVVWTFLLTFSFRWDSCVEWILKVMRNAGFLQVHCRCRFDVELMKLGRNKIDCKANLFH